MSSADGDGPHVEPPTDEAVYRVAADFPSRGFFRFYLTGGRFFRLTLSNRRVSIAPTWRVFQKFVPAASCELGDIERVIPMTSTISRGFDFVVKGGEIYRVSLFAQDRVRLADDLARRGVNVEATP